jgi:prepilin-type N-terminal cleavage/methylation domain-containing protein
MRKQEGGFTLIELVIVIVILGILAAVAIPQFYDATNSARAAAASGGKQSVASGIAIYTARVKAAPTGTQLSTEVSATRCSAGFIHIISQGSEGVKVTLVDANGGAAPTACSSAVVSVSAAKYTTAL